MLMLKHACVMLLLTLQCCDLRQSRDASLLSPHVSESTMDILYNSRHFSIEKSIQQS